MSNSLNVAYDFNLRGHRAAGKFETNAHIDRRGIFVMEITEDGRVFVGIGSKDGSLDSSITIPNADLLFLIEQYVGALKDRVAAEPNEGITEEDANASEKSLDRLRLILKRANKVG